MVALKLPTPNSRIRSVFNLVFGAPDVDFVLPDDFFVAGNAVHFLVVATTYDRVARFTAKFGRMIQTRLLATTRNGITAIHTTLGLARRTGRNADG